MAPFFNVYKTQKPIQIKSSVYRKSNYLHKHSYLRKKNSSFFLKCFLYKYLYYICRVKQLKFNHMSITEHTQKLKPLIDSASYLVRQIEICENELDKLMALPPLYRERLQDEIEMWLRNGEQYYKSLKNLTKTIGNA